MTDTPGRKPKPPNMAAASRRAAAMFLHWRRNEGRADGEMAILDEMGDAYEQWVDLVCALLVVGTQMSRVAADGGDVVDLLNHIVRLAALDEVATDA